MTDTSHDGSNPMTEGLIERIEAADGPSRELDALIWCHLNGKRYASHHQAYQSDETQVEYTEPPKRTRFVSTVNRGGHALRYTASLDSALTLVPEGWFDVRFHHHKITDGSIRAYAEIEFDLRDMALTSEGRAATPALALVAACLRARQEGGV